MKGVIITAKHHDGFCLWDTKHTKHSVMHSPYGRDIVAQLADSCRKHGLKLGIYLSPWDRHDWRYGQGKAYDDYFCAQLTELLTNYGEVFTCWFDGACGEGADGKTQFYDWPRYYAIVRELQPGAAIAVCGPDVRWCGNEAGHCRESEWSVVPMSMIDNEAVKEKSQQEDSDEFRNRIPTGGEDLGSRKALEGCGELAWYPAEVNTSIRPGWFYHESEDDKVRPLDELASIYIKSVGGNASFLLNVPPHPQGYLARQDVERLEEIGQWLRNSFSINLLANATYAASSSDADCCSGGAGPQEDGSRQNVYWKASDDDSDVHIIADAGRAVSPKYLVLQEEICLGQRIEAFVLKYWDGAGWAEAARGTVVGYKRICPLKAAASSSKWKLEIPQSRAAPTLKTFKLY